MNHLTLVGLIALAAGVLFSTCAVLEGVALRSVFAGWCFALGVIAVLFALWLLIDGAV